MTIEIALATLPDNPDDIASRLAQEECFYLVDDKSITIICPVARYLQKTTGKLVHCGCTKAWDESDDVILPPNVQRFVINFDRGNYPFLGTRY